MSEWLFELFFMNYYHYIYNDAYITLVCMCGSITFRQIPRSGTAASEGQKLNEDIVWCQLLYCLTTEWIVRFLNFLQLRSCITQ